MFKDIYKWKAIFVKNQQHKNKIGTSFKYAFQMIYLN